MRIAFDHHAFCGQSHGGVSRYFARLARHLRDLGETVAVFAPLHRNAYLAELSSGLVRGRGVAQFPSHTTGLIRAASGYLACSAIRRWVPDLVHETYFALAGTAPRGCPMVLTVFDMTHERLPDAFPKDDPTTLRKRSAVARADHVICISEHPRRDLLELFDVSSAQVSVVHLGVDRPDSVSSDRATGLTRDGVPFLLYVGSRMPYKNFGMLIRALGAAQAVRRDFGIVAFGGGPFSGAEQEMIRSAGWSDGSVRQVGGNDQVLTALFRQATALVYPSLYEGFGLPPLEAMAHGCPVVSSNASSMPEVIGDAGEFFDPTDPQCLCDAVQRVVYSSERRADLIRRGWLRVDDFSWRLCAAETASVYRSLVG